MKEKKKKKKLTFICTAKGNLIHFCNKIKNHLRPKLNFLELKTKTKQSLKLKKKYFKNEKTTEI